MIFGLLVVMLIAMPLTSFQSWATEPDGAFTATYGSGTVEDPYAGHLQTLEGEYLWDLDYPSEIYVELGTEVYIPVEYYSREYFAEGEVGFDMPYDDTIHSLCIVGTADQIGTFHLQSGSGITIESIQPMSYSLEFYIHVVEARDHGPTLMFESDPVEDGILIPPNHHLVTFIYEDSTTVYRVVEHGGWITDVPPLSNERREWRSSSTGYIGVNSIPVESDITFREMHNNTGGSSQIG